MNKLFNLITILFNFTVMALVIWFMVAVVAYILDINTTPPIKRKETVKSEDSGI